MKNICDVVELLKNPRNPLFLTIVTWNLEKGKRLEFKNSIFDGSLIVKQTFSQTEFVISESDIAHIMHLHVTKCLIFMKFEDIGY